MPSKQYESDGEIAFLVRFGFQMGCAREVCSRVILTLALKFGILLWLIFQK